MCIPYCARPTDDSTTTYFLSVVTIVSRLLKKIVHDVLRRLNIDREKKYIFDIVDHIVIEYPTENGSSGRAIRCRVTTDIIFYNIIMYYYNYYCNCRFSFDSEPVFMCARAII